MYRDKCIVKDFRERKREQCGDRKNGSIEKKQSQESKEESTNVSSGEKCSSQSPVRQ